MTNNLSYEKAVSRLEEIVVLLEKKEISLDESLALFEEGTKLVSYCSNKLNEAKQKIVEIEKE